MVDILAEKNTMSTKKNEGSRKGTLKEELIIKVNSFIIGGISFGNGDSYLKLDKKQWEKFQEDGEK